MNPRIQLFILVAVLALSSFTFVGTFAQPSGGGDTTKLEADIAALSIKIDEVMVQVVDTSKKIDTNQNANANSFRTAGEQLSSAAVTILTKLDAILVKLDEILALHASTPPPESTTFTATLEWDYNHTDDGLGPITGFNIQRSSDGGIVWYGYTQVVGADVRKYVDTPIVVGPQYCYRVIAFRVREGGAVIDYSLESSNAACTIGPTS